MGFYKLFFIYSVIFLMSACGESADINKPGNITTQSIGLSEINNFTITADEDPVKYYSLQTQAGISYSIDIINDASSSNMITVEIINTGYSPVVLTRMRMISFDYDALETTQLKIKVKGSSKAFFRYEITAHLSTTDGLEQDDTSYEPNNSKNSAYPVINGALYSSNLSQNDDFDWYSLTIIKGDSVTLFIANSISSTSFLNAQLFDENKNPISQKFIISHTSDLSEQLTIDYTGLIFIKFYGQSPSTPHSYNFSLTLSTP